MALQLSVKANYRKQGDLAEVLIYLYDSIDKLYHPEKIGTGVVEFRSGNASNSRLLGKVELTMYHGNADGAVRAMLLHPESIDNLFYTLSLTTIEPATLTSTGPFDVIEMPTQDKLAEQPPLRKP